MLNVTVSALASWEYGRASVRYGIADVFCRHFTINQRWLAYGKAPMTFYIPNFETIAAIAPPAQTDLFSEAVEVRRHEIDVYMRLLAETLQVDFRNLEREIIPIVLSQRAPFRSASVEAAAHFLLEDITSYLPISLYQALLAKLRDAIASFHRTNDRVLTVEKQKRDEARKIPLQKETIVDILATLKSNDYWEKLRERLEALTSERGAKARLAAHLGITPQAVSNWFSESRNSEPTAGVALKAQEWVAAEEKKRKRKS